MNEEVLGFSYNWNNKLDCKAFTSIRLDSAKYVIGNKYTIVMKGRQPEQATLMDKKVFKLSQLTAFMSYIDTGYSLDECKNIIRTMYKNMPRVNVDLALFAFLLLVKDKK